MAAAIGDETYVNLATFRKNGNEVRTPVWIAPDGDRLLVYTNAKSGKVKRIRNQRRARLAPCDMLGKLRGHWLDASARMLDAPGALDRALGPLLRTYAWPTPPAPFSSRVS